MSLERKLVTPCEISHVSRAKIRRNFAQAIGNVACVRSESSTKFRQNVAENKALTSTQFAIITFFTELSVKETPKAFSGSFGHYQVVCFSLVSQSITLCCLPTLADRKAYSRADLLALRHCKYDQETQDLFMRLKITGILRYRGPRRFRGWTGADEHKLATPVLSLSQGIFTD